MDLIGRDVSLSSRGARGPYRPRGSRKGLHDASVGPDVSHIHDPPGDRVVNSATKVDEDGISTKNHNKRTSPSPYGSRNRKTMMKSPRSVSWDRSGPRTASRTQSLNFPSVSGAASDRRRSLDVDLGDEEGDRAAESPPPSRKRSSFVPSIDDEENAVENASALRSVAECVSSDDEEEEEKQDDENGARGSDNNNNNNNNKGKKKNDDDDDKNNVDDDDPGLRPVTVVRALQLPSSSSLTSPSSSVSVSSASAASTSPVAFDWDDPDAKVPKRKVARLPRGFGNVPVPIVLDAPPAGGGVDLSLGALGIREGSTAIGGFQRRVPEAPVVSPREKTGAPSTSSSVSHEAGAGGVKPAHHNNLNHNQKQFLGPHDARKGSGSIGSGSDNEASSGSGRGGSDRVKRNAGGGRHGPAMASIREATFEHLDAYETRAPNLVCHVCCKSLPYESHRNHIKACAADRARELRKLPRSMRVPLARPECRPPPREPPRPGDVDDDGDSDDDEGGKDKKKGKPSAPAAFDASVHNAHASAAYQRSLLRCPACGVRVAPGDPLRAHLGVDAAGAAAKCRRVNEPNDRELLTLLIAHLRGEAGESSSDEDTDGDEGNIMKNNAISNNSDDDDDENDNGVGHKGRRGGGGGGGGGGGSNGDSADHRRRQNDHRGGVPSNTDPHERERFAIGPTKSLAGIPGATVHSSVNLAGMVGSFSRVQNATSASVSESSGADIHNHSNYNHNHSTSYNSHGGRGSPQPPTAVSQVSLPIPRFDNPVSLAVVPRLTCAMCGLTGPIADHFRHVEVCRTGWTERQERVPESRRTEAPPRPPHRWTVDDATDRAVPCEHNAYENGGTVVDLARVAEVLSGGGDDGDGDDDRGYDPESGIPVPVKIVDAYNAAAVSAFRSRWPACELCGCGVEPARYEMHTRACVVRRGFVARPPKVAVGLPQNGQRDPASARHPSQSHGHGHNHGQNQSQNQGQSQSQHHNGGEAASLAAAHRAAGAIRDSRGETIVSRRLLTCHSCGHEFGASKLRAHIHQCLRWRSAIQASLPVHLRRVLAEVQVPLPVVDPAAAATAVKGNTSSADPTNTNGSVFTEADYANYDAEARRCYERSKAPCPTCGVPFAFNHILRHVDECAREREEKERELEGEGQHFSDREREKESVAVETRRGKSGSGRGKSRGKGDGRGDDDGSGGDGDEDYTYESEQSDDDGKGEEDQRQTVNDHSGSLGTLSGVDTARPKGGIAASGGIPKGAFGAAVGQPVWGVPSHRQIAGSSRYVGGPGRARGAFAGERAFRAPPTGGFVAFGSSSYPHQVVEVEPPKVFLAIEAKGPDAYDEPLPRDSFLRKTGSLLHGTLGEAPEFIFPNDGSVVGSTVSPRVPDRVQAVTVQRVASKRAQSGKRTSHPIGGKAARGAKTVPRNGTEAQAKRPLVLPEIAGAVAAASGAEMSWVAGAPLTPNRTVATIGGRGRKKIGPEDASRDDVSAGKVKTQRGAKDTSDAKVPRVAIRPRDTGVTFGGAMG